MTDRQILETRNFHGHTLRIYDDGLRSKVLQPWRNRGIYEHPLLEEIYNCNYDGTAIDIGSGIGNHTLWFAKVCNMSVIAFDPDIKACMSFLDNLVLNGLDHQNIGLVVTALDETYGLDYYLEENEIHISFIKMDVEGMEPDILRGSLETIQRQHPVIYAEEWHQEAHDKIAEILEPLGYKMTILFKLGTPVGKWVYE